MIHFIPDTFAMEVVEKVGVPVVAITGVVVSQLGPVGDLPGWASGSIVTISFGVLIYLLKYAIGLWQTKDNEIKDMNAKQIKALKEELDLLRKENHELRRHDHERR